MDAGPKDVMHAFDQFENSDHIKGGDVRTKGPFLNGILNAIHKKSKSIQTRPLGDFNWPPHIFPSVRNCFQQLVFDPGLMWTNEMEPKTMLALAELFEPDAIALLEEFATLERSKLKNPNAYLYGMIRKTISRQGGKGAPSGNAVGNRFGGGPEPFFGGTKRDDEEHLDMLHAKLCPATRNELQLMYDSGFCWAEELQDKVFDFLSEIPEGIAVEAIHEFRSCDRSRISRISPFFFGIIQKACKHHGGAMTLGGGAHMKDNFGPMHEPTGIKKVAGVPHPSDPKRSRPGDWECPHCHKIVFASKIKCFNCGAPKPFN